MAVNEAVGAITLATAFIFNAVRIVVFYLTVKK